MSGSPQLAEDVTQDVFIALMRDGHQFDPARGTVAGYLYGMARHRVLRRLERERSFVSLTEEEEETPLGERFVAGDDPLVEYAQQELAETVRKAVLALPPHYRESSCCAICKS
jgi:RNA polymerase sigma-70 factor (ECF subfamily)